MSNQRQRFQDWQTALINSFESGILAEPTPEALHALTDTAHTEGTAIADEVNGLFSADPVQFDNPDLASPAVFSALQTVGLFPNNGQGAATIRMNAGDAQVPGIHVKVWPMVANGDGSFSRAPEVGEGTEQSAPWIPNAWLLSPKGNLADNLRAFRLPTFTPSTPGGPMV